MKKRVLSLLLVLMMVLSLVPISALAWPGSDTDIAYAVTGGNIYFDRSTGTITGCDSEVTEANIPSEIDGVPVTNIWGFAHCASLKSVKIPNSVKSIYDCAFEDCTNLTDVTIPNGAVNIGNSAFSGCKSLIGITIPDSVTSIGSHAFEGTGITSVMIPESVTSIGYIAFTSCKSLTSINVADNNTAYCSVNGVLFNKDKTEIIQYPAGKEDSFYAIPESVISIAWSAFQGCKSLTNVEIPDSVTAIGNSAFSNCESLLNVTIPDSVTSIEISAFSNCNSLTSVTIPNKVTGIGWCTFSGCSALTSVTIPDSVTYIDPCAFSGCTSLKSIKIPDNVTSIGTWAFHGCQSLTNVVIPNNVTSIGLGAFEGAGLTNVMIPSSVTLIGGSAFADCISLISINVADENTTYCSINGVMFNKDKTELIQYTAGRTDASYAIPNSVTSIAYGAFQGCTRFKSIEIPNSVTSIGYSAFSGCTGLTNIEISDSVTSIGWGAFSSCASLTSAAIPNGVTSIDGWVFNGCTSLVSITIPTSVISIGISAFNDCPSLTDVYYTGTEEQWNAISIEYEFNDDRLNATIHYNYHEHVTETVGAEPATCTDSGYTGDEVCTICGEVISQGEVIDATGHHFKGNTCPDCGATRSTADTIRAFFQTSFNNFKSFFDKLFGR